MLPSLGRRILRLRIVGRVVVVGVGVRLRRRRRRMVMGVGVVFHLPPRLRVHGDGGCDVRLARPGRHEVVHGDEEERAASRRWRRRPALECPGGARSVGVGVLEIYEEPHGRDVVLVSRSCGSLGAEGLGSGVVRLAGIFFGREAPRRCYAATHVTRRTANVVCASQ